LTKGFAYFGGVPKKLKVDNMKTAVVRNTRSELEFNVGFLEFAKQYGFIVKPCTPYSPQQKGKVEAGIKYLQGNFINGRTFLDDHDIARQLTAWMQTYANQRMHGTTRKISWEQLVSQERSRLMPLPEEEYAFFLRGFSRSPAISQVNGDVDRMKARNLFGRPAPNDLCRQSQ
jgi:hypothetical protein